MSAFHVCCRPIFPSLARSQLDIRRYVAIHNAVIRSSRLRAAVRVSQHHQDAGSACSGCTHYCHSEAATKASYGRLQCNLACTDSKLAASTHSSSYRLITSGHVSPTPTTCIAVSWLGGRSGCSRQLKMVLKDSLFSIDASNVTLGAVLAKCSPGVALYKADLRLGERSMDVSELLSMQLVISHSC